MIVQMYKKQIFGQKNSEQNVLAGWQVDRLAMATRNTELTASGLNANYGQAKASDGFSGSKSTRPHSTNTPFIRC